MAKARRLSPHDQQTRSSRRLRAMSELEESSADVASQNAALFYDLDDSDSTAVSDEQAYTDALAGDWGGHLVARLN